MFKVGDVVVYESLGVCRVVDIRNERFAPLEEQQYYILQMVYGVKTTIYAPVGNENIKIRKVLPRDEIISIIKAMPDEQSFWIDNEQERKETYGKIIKNGDRTMLIRLIKTLYEKKKEREKIGKNLYLSDDKLMKDAEQLLYEEFAYVLEIEPGEVLSYITGEIGEPAE